MHVWKLNNVSKYTLTKKMMEKNKKTYGKITEDQSKTSWFVASEASEVVSSPEKEEARN